MSVTGEITSYNDFSLIVRIGTQVFVIPKSDLDTYENIPLASQDKHTLDSLFNAYKHQPAVDSVLVPTIHYMGGGRVTP